MVQVYQPKLRVIDTVYHEDYGECLVMSPEENGLIDIKMKGNKEWIRDVPVEEVTIYGLKHKQEFIIAGEWCMSPYALTLLGKPASMRMLEFLMNWNYTAGRKREWFYATTMTIVRRAYMTPKAVEASFRILRGIGYVATDNWSKGDRKRYVRINYESIAKDLRNKKKEWERKYPKMKRDEPEY